MSLPYAPNRAKFKIYALQHRRTLFCLKPETLHGNVVESARLMQARA
jgi:hypothetical protein